MKTESEQVQRWDDIIFEKRNKEYGAYAIRKSYDDRVLTGWTISLGVIALIFLSSFFPGEEIIPAPPEVTFITGLMPAPKFKVDPPKTQAPEAPKQFNKDLPPVVTVKEIPDPPEPLKPVEPVDHGGTGSTTGTINNGSVQSAGVDLGEPIDVPVSPPYLLAPEVMPAYEGGMEAMMKFLQKKLRYPSSAQHRKIEGTVYVSFIISSTGEVTNIEIVKGFYKDCDKEAARVISLMNKWKPGFQNKMPVAVKMVLPIKFKLDS
jgi:protein TonB